MTVLTTLDISVITVEKVAQWNLTVFTRQLSQRKKKKNFEYTSTNASIESFIDISFKNKLYVEITEVIDNFGGVEVDANK